MEEVSSLQVNYQPAEVQYKLARAWQYKGRIERAIKGYQAALDLQSDYLPAYEKLGYLMLTLNRIEEAMEYYDRALAIDFENVNLIDYYQALGWQPKPDTSRLILDSSTSFLVEHPEGKIKLNRQEPLHCHRSGWNYAIQSLKTLHNSQGILFDGFLEINFSWKYPTEEKKPPRVLEKMRRDRVFQALTNTEEKGIIPYTKPWVGFIHNPQNMPTWFLYKESPQVMFSKKAWKASLEHCVGLFALSNYHAKWLREETGKIVSVLYHPTEIPNIQFDFKRFRDNTQKKIVQIGWWLRKLNAIYQLPIAEDNPLSYQKIRLIPHFSDYTEQILSDLMTLEQKNLELEFIDEFIENTREIYHLSNDDYDALLSQNIVFINLYDASANNAIIECIARATPLLINPLPSVIEYLGEDYPMYFEDLEEAAQKVMDISLIWDTHQYLKQSDIRLKISADHFLKSFRESEVYQLL